MSVLAVLAALLFAALLVALHWRPSLQPYTGLAYTSPSEAERGLKLQFFGNTTVLLQDQQNAIMIDGFVSRPGLLRILTMPIGPDTERIDAALAKGAVERVDALFVAHSHHDHAMDAGVVAQKTGATVFGSESTLNIARGDGVTEDRLVALQVGQAYSFGDFKVTAFETPHSPDPVFLGHIETPLEHPARLSAYKMAENYSFLVDHPLGRVLIVPSANYTPDTFAGIRADVVLLGIGSLGKQTDDFAEKYWDETTRLVGARLALPIHWDDFGRGLELPLVPMPYLLDDFDASMAQLERLAARDGVEVRLLPVFDPVYLPLGTREGEP